MVLQNNTLIYPIFIVNILKRISEQARNLVLEGFQDADTPYENNKRIGSVLYSGDIVNLYE